MKSAVKTALKTRVIPATEFKAKCLAILDEVDGDGGTVTITKRGRPVAVLGPAQKSFAKPLLGAWIGKVKLPKDWEKIEFTDRFNVLKEIDD
jgi:prevent-host-death family protein